MDDSGLKDKEHPDPAVSSRQPTDRMPQESQSARIWRSTGGVDAVGSAPSSFCDPTNLSIRDVGSRSTDQCAHEEDPEKNAEASKSSPEDEELADNCILRIMDVPTEGSDPKAVLFIHVPDQAMNVSPELVAQHPSDTARIFEYTVDEALMTRGQKEAIENSLAGYMTGTYGRTPSDWVSLFNPAIIGTRPATDADNLCAQLSQTLESPYLETIWTATRIRPSKREARVGYSTSSFCCVRTRDNRILVIVVNCGRGTLTFSTKKNTFAFSNLDLVDLILKKSSTWTSIGGGGLERLTLSLVLQFLLTCVFLREPRYFETFLKLHWGHFREDPLFHMIFSLPQAPVSVIKGSNSEITYQLEKCERILQAVQDVTWALFFLLDLPTTSGSTPSGDKKTVHCEGWQASTHLKIRTICTQRVLNCQRRIERMNRTIETHNRLLSIRESNSVKRLTILAALFLPASLASSFLSMSTRFKDLGPLFYDWFGAFVTISSTTILLNITVKASLYLKKRFGTVPLSPKSVWFLSKKPSGLFNRTTAVLYIFGCISAWGILIASFVLGMFRDIKFGARILGFTALGILLTLFSCFLAFCFIRPKTYRNKRLNPGKSRG